MDKAIHFLNVLHFNKVFGIKIFHLTGYLCRKGRGIKTGNFSDTGFPVDKILPCSLNTHTKGCYKTQACYNNSPTIHYAYDFFLLIYSMASLTFAIFSTVPNLPRGMSFFISSFTFSGSTSVIADVIKPGATAFTVIPLLAYSFAAVFVSPIIPALEAL